jgi:hypothetical protein
MRVFETIDAPLDCNELFILPRSKHHHDGRLTQALR